MSLLKTGTYRKENLGNSKYEVTVIVYILLLVIQKSATVRDSYLVRTQIFLKNCTCAYQGVVNVSFSDNFEYVLNG